MANPSGVLRLTHVRVTSTHQKQSAIEEGQRGAAQKNTVVPKERQIMCSVERHHREKKALEGNQGSA